MIGSATRRIFFTENAQLAIAEPVEGKPVTLTGYPLVWNVLSTDRGGYKVRLMPGSATFTPRFHALWDHEWRDVLGCNENGTVRLTPDAIGIHAEIDLPDTSAGRDVATLVRRKDLKGMSFAMVDDPKVKKVTENGQIILNALSYLVDEITITARPAFLEAIVGMKPDAAITEPSYAQRKADAIRFERLKLDLYRLPGQSRAAV